MGSSGFNVNPEVRNALAVLCADKRNTEFVVSGDSQENNLKVIVDVPGVGIAASNGACFA
jgi:trehalose-6-phosphatase